MSDYYHYTHENNVTRIKASGVFPDHPYFTTDEYYDANTAGQKLGIMPHNINCVLKFRDDGRFRRVEDVPSSNRFYGGGTQFKHPSSPKPVEKRRISERNWTSI